MAGLSTCVGAEVDAGATVDTGTDNTGAGKEGSREETIAQLRRQMAAVPSRVDRRREHAPGLAHTTVPRSREPDSTESRTVSRNRDADREILVALPGLADVLPAGGIERGSVTSVTGASLLIGLLAQATAQGGYAAVVGQRGLGLLAAVEMGADLSRIALVPDPGADRVGVAAVLLDGMDLVVLDLDGASVPPSRSRAVVARARSRGVALVVTGGEWEGADVRIDSQVGGYEGLGAGHGRVRGMHLDVRARGRSFPTRGTRLALRHQHGRMGWEASGEAEADQAGHAGGIRHGA